MLEYTELDKWLLGMCWGSGLTVAVAVVWDILRDAMRGWLASRIIAKRQNRKG